jgi:hypothetical protein
MMEYCVTVFLPDLAHLPDARAEIPAQTPWGPGYRNPDQFMYAEGLYLGVQNHEANWLTELLPEPERLEEWFTVHVGGEGVAHLTPIDKEDWESTGPYCDMNSLTTLVRELTEPHPRWAVVFLEQCDRADIQCRITVDELCALVRSLYEAEGLARYGFVAVSRREGAA